MFPDGCSVLSNHSTLCTPSPSLALLDVAVDLKKCGSTRIFLCPTPFGDRCLFVCAMVKIMISSFITLTHHPSLHYRLFVNNFYNASNELQREKYLEKTMSGEWIGAMGMSEPSAGTDVLGMSTKAVRQGDYYVLNGSKTWITNATHANVFLVYAKVDGAVTAFLVERGMEGFTNGNKIDKCGMRGSTMAELFFDNVKVPVENRIGEEGGGVMCMMRNLELERLTLAAMSVGIAERCCEVMFDWANQRKAFGKPIAQYGQIQKYIAEGFTKTEAAKVLTYAVARSVGPNSQNRIGTDAAKLFATPIGKEVADASMQVLGGMGYARDMPVERLWRDAKLLEVCGLIQM